MGIPKIYGFNKTSEAGVNVFAPSIFVQGCNLKCPYCLNSSLAKSSMKEDNVIPLETIDNLVEKENPDMIMISGGEPLMINNLVELIDHFRSKGLKIGLSTNGTLLSRLLSTLPFLSYVALDIKSSDPNVYDFLGTADEGGLYESVIRSRELLFENKLVRKDFDYEIRTTLYPPYIDVNTIHDLGKLMNKSERWILQQYRPTKNLYDMESIKGVDPYDFHILKEMLIIARTYTKDSHLRYV